MSENAKRLYEALAQIAAVASAAVNGGAFPDDEYDDTHAPEQVLQQGVLVCTPKTLPTRLLVKAAETATKINPVNAPVFGPLAAVAEGFVDPLRIAVVTSIRARRPGRARIDVVTGDPFHTPQTTTLDITVEP